MSTITEKKDRAQTEVLNKICSAFTQGKWSVQNGYVRYENRFLRVASVQNACMMMIGLSESFLFTRPGIFTLDCVKYSDFLVELFNHKNPTQFKEAAVHHFVDRYWNFDENGEECEVASISEDESGIEKVVIHHDDADEILSVDEFLDQTAIQVDFTMNAIRRELP